MLERGAPLGIEPTLALLRGLNFGVEHLYLDPSPNNEAGAGYFMYGPPGSEQALLVQVRCRAGVCAGLLAAFCVLRTAACVPCPVNRQALR